MELIGRTAEIASLRSLVGDAGRSGRIGIVEGEAGIGKTRLLEATLGSARVLSCRAEEIDFRRPFAPIVDLVASAGEPGWPERLEQRLAADESPGELERRFVVSELVLELLEHLAARGPLVVAVEDLHWADAATLEVVGRTARGIEQLPVALLLSTRPAPRSADLNRLLVLLERRGAELVTVPPLDAADSSELATRLLGGSPGPHLAEHLRGAAGNPFFVTELIAALLAEDAVERRDGEAEISVAQPTPPLPMTIVRRLRMLGSDELELLGLAAVLGRSFTVRDLAALADRPPGALASPLRAAIEAGALAVGEERLAFRHELIRDALYEDLAPPIRRALHLQLAGALRDAGEPGERVAEHTLRGALPGDERSVASLVKVARELAGGSPAVAVDLYRSAIELSPSPAQTRASVLPDLAEALFQAGFLEDAETACREALANGVDANWAARLRLHLVLLLTRRARMAEAVAEGEAGLADTRLAASDHARLRALVAMSRVFLGDADGPVAEARAVLEDDAADEPARSIAVNALALAADSRGRFAEAAELMLPRARWADEEGSRAAHETRPHMLLTLMLVRLDRLDDAYANVQRGRLAAESLGLGDALPVFHNQLATVHYWRGQLDDALAELDTHQELAEQTGIGWWLPVLSLRALVDLHLDEVLHAEHHVAAAEREAAEGAPPFGTDLMLVARARLLEAAGQTERATEVLADAFAAFTTAGAATFQPLVGAELARLAARAGDPGRAADVVPELERIAALNPGARSLEAAALRVRGLVEREAEPLIAAVELMRAVGRPLDLAELCEDAAHILAAGDRTKARELLGEAQRLYEETGASRDLARVDAALRALGARRGARGPRRRPKTGWEALTDTELKVVRLVAERLSNQEIAERLFISRRTVQTHVSHVLAKLDVSTRREIAEEAARVAGWRLTVEDAREGGAQGGEPQPTAD